MADSFWFAVVSRQIKILNSLRPLCLCGKIVYICPGDNISFIHHSGTENIERFPLFTTETQRSQSFFFCRETAAKENHQSRLSGINFVPNNM